MKVDRLLRPARDAAFRAELLMVCFFFLLGAVLGCVGHRTVSPQEDSLLQRYLQEYASLVAQGEDQSAALLRVLAVYLRYPLALFACGFTVLGIVLVPVLLAAQGGFLAFSVACYASAMGRNGVLLALSGFGLRCLVVLPCVLLIAIDAWRGAWSLRQRRGSRHKKREEVYRPAQYGRFAVCIVILLLGVVAEMSLVPKLLTMALERIL